MNRTVYTHSPSQHHRRQSKLDFKGSLGRRAVTCLHKRILSSGSHFITNLVSLCKAGSEKRQEVWTEPQYLLQQNMGTVKNSRTQEPTGQDRAAKH